MRLYKFTSTNITPYYTLADSVTDAISNYKKRHTGNATITKYSHSQGVHYTLNNIGGQYDISRT